jgi:hypothetical protein
MLVDPKSHDLAEYFLADCEMKNKKVTVMALAEVIQEAVEGWYIEAREEGHIKERSGEARDGSGI